MSRRRALRDFYAIEGQNTPEIRIEGEPDVLSDPHNANELTSKWLSQLDQPDFDAEKWTQALLSSEGAAGVLRVHKALSRQSRALDSEQKALVYNNYRKMTRASEALAALAGDGALDALAEMQQPLQDLAAALGSPRFVNNAE